MSGCGKVAPQAGVQPAQRQQQAAAPQEKPQQAQVKVSIDNFSFTPAEVTVAPGSTVVWVNHDDVPHTVTATAKQFGSKALDTDDTFSHRFDAAGTYDYFCAVHRHMVGRVIVK